MTGRHSHDWPLTALPPGSAWDSLHTDFGSFLKDPLVVLGDNFPDDSNPNIIFYKFNTSHMNFIQNEHVKLDETCLDTQGLFKENLSNIMDVLGRLTSKLHETQHTAYICYNNSFKYLTTP